jgi:hypothetical protein
MKIGWRIPVSMMLAAVLATAHQAGAQRTRGPMVTSLQATTDKGGAHPATAEIKGPAPIMCIGGVSETPHVVVSCSITAPGFKGILKKGEKANATGAGTVTLACNGAGYMRCNARIN